MTAREFAKICPCLASPSVLSGIGLHAHSLLLSTWKFYERKTGFLTLGDGWLLSVGRCGAAPPPAGLSSISIPET